MRTFSRAPWRNKRRLWRRSNLLLVLLFARGVWADEASDRAAIGSVIAALNEFPQHPELFTADSDAPVVLRQLGKGKRPTYRPRAGEQGSPSPSVTISHEPWGEATIHLSGPAREVVNPRIVSHNIRFITPDVALIDGACSYQEDGAPPQTTPLLFVAKKEAGRWKIASLRVLAPHP